MKKQKEKIKFKPDENQCDFGFTYHLLEIARNPNSTWVEIYNEAMSIIDEEEGSFMSELLTASCCAAWEAAMIRVSNRAKVSSDALQSAICPDLEGGAGADGDWKNVIRFCVEYDNNEYINRVEIKRSNHEIMP